MKKPYLFALFGGVLSSLSSVHGQDIDPASNPNVQPNSPTLLAYRLAWSDEFSGSSLNTAKWNYRQGDDNRSVIKSFQTSANNAVSGGLYRCILKKQSMGTKQFTAGGIISKKKMRYGYYETRLKTPPTRGWHTSFWTYPNFSTSTVVELDFFESDSINNNSYFVNAHSWKPTPHVAYGTKTISTPDLSASFNTVGCEYTPTELRYYFNGNLVQTTNAAQFPHGDMNVMLTSIGLVYSNQPAIDESQLPAQAQFAYVRFFEPTGGSGPGATNIVVDNGTSGYTETSGTWNTSGLTGNGGSNTRFSNSTGASAKWTPNITAAGSYEVSIYKVTHASSDTNTKVDVVHAGGTSSQFLNYTSGSAGWVVLGTYNFNSGTGGNVKITRGNSNVRADAVRFRATDTGNGVTPPSSWTQLEFRHSGKCVDNKGLIPNGSEYHQWTCGANANRNFRFESRGGGWWNIRSQKSNRCLDVANGSNADGAKLHQWDCSTSNINQSWKVVDKGGGWFNLVSQKSNKCVDVSASSTANQAKIQQWSCHGGNNQQMKFR